MSLSNEPIHPGVYVRQHVIPAGMSVKDAASRLGIGRPALSNFLNGNSALSARMATRLEKAFGADRQQLVDMQAAYDRQEQRAGESVLAVRAFVPPFISIKARQIEDWADKQIEARTHLPVLLRTLVHSTGTNLHRVDFPGFDNAQRRGTDGFVEAGAATPWIPEGNSYWEFGTNERPGEKAEHDYVARLKSVNANERSKSTFVFVTPRNWDGKIAWGSEKNEAGDWRAVRAFDASDLEQWLEQSVPAQIWLAEQLSMTIDGYETLQQAWHRWADATEPHLTSEIFAPSLTVYRSRFKEWLEKPSEKPFVVAADSKDEALAFLACLFDDEALRRFGDLSAIFSSPDTLRTLVASSVPFIPIVYSEYVERELVDVYRRLHCIVLRPRNAVDTEADVALDLLNHEAFEKALIAIGVEQPDVERLARESGLSPTILRRRLSPNTAIRTPAWAGDDKTAKTLVPIALVGAWHTEAEADREIVSNLAGADYKAIEYDIAHLLRFDDPPVWSVGRYRGVTSKIDALFSVAGMVTSEDLEQFFLVAEIVLSESDPSLELPEEQRWAAAVYGKTRNHSSALREGICETLVILSVHGNNLFQDRLGFDAEGQVAVLIRKLLTPLTLEKLLSQDHDLPRYAEAAPDVFLRILEEDLQNEKPVVFGLLKPVESGAFFASPSRTGLLWALECLAWKPLNLVPVSLILAQLSEIKINDNWMNKPDASIQAIFRSWMPQTAADLNQRIKALETLAKRFPDVGWKICIAQTEHGTRFGHYSYRPRWRGDASGSGEVVTPKEMYAFTRKALDLLLTRPSYNEDTLGSLVESLQGIPDEDQSKVWDLIDEWSETADEVAKAALRERIRRFAFTRRSRQRKLTESARDRAREAYEKLQSDDPVIRHGWLFADSWVQESLDEIEEDDFDYKKRGERIDRLRQEAIVEVWTKCGFEGVKDLLASSGAAGTVGHYIARCICGIESRQDFVRCCLSIEGGIRSKAEWCLQGFLSSIEMDEQAAVLRGIADHSSLEERGRLFTCAPFRASTWRLIDLYGDELAARYWSDVVPAWSKHTDSELSELIDRLLDAKRPRAAFHVVHLQFADVETSRLRRVLHDVATVSAEPVDHYRPDAYMISEALDALGNRAGVARDEMARLEFLFIDALEHSKHGIPNLESQVAESPELFVQAVVLAYKRSDRGEDPPEWKIENDEHRSAVARAAHNLLDRLRKSPGTDEGGDIDVAALTSWLAEVRRQCREYDRADIGDHCIGQLLSKSPEDADGLWPCEAVCEAMEGMASARVGEGFRIGVYNSRGVYSKAIGEGGAQERELAGKYRDVADRLRYDYPYVGRVIESIAVSYEHEAGREDSEAKVRKRLGR